MTDILYSLLGGVIAIAIGFALLYRFSRLDGKMVAVVAALLVVGIYMPTVIITWPGADVFAIHIAVYLVTVYVLGIISSQRDARRADGETGRWFHWGPAAIVIFFMVVIAVNSVYILLAQKGLDSEATRWLLPEPHSGGEVSSHFPGTVARDFRNEQDEFNQFQQRFEEQQERGWQVQKGWLGEARAGQASVFKLRVLERDGTPISDAEVRGLFLRPGDSRLDQAFVMSPLSDEPGSYLAEPVLPEGGRWELLLQIRRGEQRHEIKASTRIEAAR
ncbi:FixH family protein [Thiohalophilus sp.]|uniref:FixH family protein n=1 Tax=Thiohalophilus sp. TaxID=3028392 RepID=UPI002ACE56DA|nr:FixH family protein [Thiohalophilus sp.]MDZ7803701.1 FixH family protein [Thiohalophilus sp.]